MLEICAGRVIVQSQEMNIGRKKEALSRAPRCPGQDNYCQIPRVQEAPRLKRPWNHTSTGAI